MDWLDLSWWGSAASIVGLVVALVGLGFVGYQAWGAKQAASQTRDAVTDVLTFGSGNRATTLIQQLKHLLQKSQWDAAYHQFHTLRTSIGDLKMSATTPEDIQRIEEAVASLMEMEEDINVGIQKERDPTNADSHHATLNSIQATLEGIMRHAAARRGGPNG